MPLKNTLLQALKVSEPSSTRAGRNQREAREGMGGVARKAEVMLGAW
ncbi:hypothetical protein [Xanthomonas campestris]